MTISKSRRHALAIGCVSTIAAACMAWPMAAQAQAATANAAAADPIPLEDFFKRAQYREMLASPSGRYLASTSARHGRLNLVVLDLEKRNAVALTDYDNIDVGNLQWVGDGYVLFSAIQLNAPSGQDNPRAGGLFSAALDGSGITRLAMTASQHARNQTGGFMYMQMVQRVHGSPDEIIAAAVVANDDSADLYRVNVSNGKYRLLTQGRPSDRISRWILDSNQVPRVAIAGTAGATTGVVTYYRAGPDAPWKEINRFDTTQPPAFVPLGFEDDDKHLLVASNHGSDAMAIHRFNPDTGRYVERIARHPQYDLGGSPQGAPTATLIRGGARNTTLLGLRFDTDRPDTVWFDAEMDRLQATINGALPGRTNLLQRTTEGKRLLVNSFNDTSPGRFYLFDVTARKLEEIGPTMPWLEGKLASVRPFRLKTRDGLEIPSYYVLPRNYQPGQRLPTVVHVHGGPMARDVRAGGRYGASFGVVEAQLLASRGYAVVLPNFRVTPEIGSKIYYAGFGTYGQQMSDDHEDAAQWAVAQGFADPKRICISGASYGGYASLHAVSRPSNPFACAISGLPVTDLGFQRREADYAENRASLEYWRKLQGVKDWDDPLVQTMSPVNNVSRIKVPVFMYVGDSDRRTPPKQAERMAEALKAAGNPVKGYFIGKDEGHGYGVAANNVALYEQILKFLDASIGR